MFFGNRHWELLVGEWLVIFGRLVWSFVIVGDIGSRT